MSSHNGWRRWIRVVHRDLGYFVAGGFIIYAVSGFVLSMRSVGVDLITVEEPVHVSLPPDLTSAELVAAWDAQRGDLPAMKGVDSIEGGFSARIGKGVVYYESATGNVQAVVRAPRGWLRLVNRMHFNGLGEWRVLGIFFAISLLFLTASGVILLRGKNGFARRGVWFALGGVGCVILFALL